MLFVRLGTRGLHITAFLLAEMNAAKEFHIGAGINLSDMTLGDIGDKEAEGAAFFCRERFIVKTIDNDSVLHRF